MPHPSETGDVVHLKVVSISVGLPRDVEARES
jgi:hypothetical protein